LRTKRAINTGISEFAFPAKTLTSPTTPTFSQISQNFTKFSFVMNPRALRDNVAFLSGSTFTTSFTKVNSGLLSASRTFTSSMRLPEMTYLERCQNFIDEILQHVEHRHLNLEREYEAIPEWLIVLRNQSAFLGSPDDSSSDLNPNFPITSDRLSTQNAIFERFHNQINDQETPTSDRLVRNYISVLNDLTMRNEVLKKVLSQLEMAEIHINRETKAKLQLKVEIARLKADHGNWNSDERREEIEKARKLAAFQGDWHRKKKKLFDEID
jgi:hypothetical protein